MNNLRAMTAEEMKLLVDACDREQIHVPGAIQEFGALVVLAKSDLQVVQVSRNTDSIFGMGPEALIGKSAQEFLDATAMRALKENQARIVGEGFSANVWYQEKLILIEAEKTVMHYSARIESRALDRLQNAKSLKELLGVTVREVADVTGLDRVMIYKFHADLHGEVVAEFVKPNVDSYLGLHYPASDIPMPARAVFLKNWVRMIPKVNYQSVPLLPLLNPLTGQPLDLGASMLRAVSPVHIEYLKNMQVGATLTISLIVDGKLWGLIACHGIEECYISIEKRDACEAIGRMTSAFIAIQTQSELNQAREKFHEICSRLSENMDAKNDLSKALIEKSPNLLDLISATGSAAALYLAGYWAKVGETPNADQLEELVDWLEKEHAGEAVYTTDSLAKEFAPAAPYQTKCCGVMALAIPKTTRNYILWFRPELKTTVHWAGKPEKKIDESGRLHPRESFSVWSEEVSGYSEKWSELEKRAATELRSAVMAIDLQVQYQKEQEARGAAERAMRSREELMAVLSHDLKNPIGSIRLGAQFATRFLTSESFEKVRPYLTRIDRATSNMDHLINDILAITKMEAGHMEAEKEMIDIGELLIEVVDMVGPIASEKSIQLRYDISHDQCETLCDRGQIFQVVSNILGNAIKFTPENGKILIVLESCGPEFLKIAVTDTGPGIPPENLPNVFDRFWQANQTKRLGTGLGLAIVKGIVESHGGKAWAESDGKNGTTFHVTIPYSPKHLRRKETI